ncbi:hypothetical protein LAJ19_18240 (plasmid) [Deinococcus taeanensis]|uniref:hypothetical protein n=1 Tax=Deinococcus taeanensis TaxID=2737050 RepID=UPI001CDC9E83|nr:hypothetical protein [Deinococcus taeanensis]UBV45064.1 hypothetical protein LAJ19_18240 [Deinococcus taeanensis]
MTRDRLDRMNDRMTDDHRLDERGERETRLNDRQDRGGMDDWGRGRADDASRRQDLHGQEDSMGLRHGTPDHYEWNRRPRRDEGGTDRHSAHSGNGLSVTGGRSASTR